MRVRFIKEFDKRGSIIQIKIYKLKETKIKKNYESNYDCHFNYKVLYIWCHSQEI